jgi:hypothetical protein
MLPLVIAVVSGIIDLIWTTINYVISLNLAKQLSTQPGLLVVGKVLVLNDQCVLIYTQPSGAEPLNHVIQRLNPEERYTWEGLAHNRVNDDEKDLPNDRKIHRFLTAYTALTVYEVARPYTEVPLWWSASDLPVFAILLGESTVTQRFILNRLDSQGRPTRRSFRQRSKAAATEIANTSAHL